MSRNLRILVEYDGTDFSGWQRQPQMRTVQASLEKAIAQMTGETVLVRGAGRTDAGVHAAGQVANFTLTAAIPEAGLLRGLNSILPKDIAILEVAAVAETFDARFSARGKVYRYLIWNHLVRSPLYARRSWHCRSTLDLEIMRQAAAQLGGEHDFRAFRASDCERRSTVRHVRRFDIDRQGALLSLEIEATAFLKNMVRILVGTLVDMGRGRIAEDIVTTMLRTGDRAIGGVTAPAQGLTLVRVLY
ncbi:MAG TPA: tRNA pseudouridine(38-40) synthase TruA [Polyangia bacterium]|nr:tRNA pseudouridine(38-40) synthase TruA [Polyangia bacterium]